MNLSHVMLKWVYRSLSLSSFGMTTIKILRPYSLILAPFFRLMNLVNLNVKIQCPIPKMYIYYICPYKFKVVYPLLINFISFIYIHYSLSISDTYWSNGKTGDYLTLGMFVYTVSFT